MRGLKIKDMDFHKAFGLCKKFLYISTALGAIVLLCILIDWIPGVEIPPVLGTCFVTALVLSLAFLLYVTLSSMEYISKRLKSKTTIKAD